MFNILKLPTIMKKYYIILITLLSAISLSMTALYTNKAKKYNKLQLKYGA